MAFDQVKEQFLKHFYAVYDSPDRSNLAALYRGDSLMTFEGAQLQGVEAIMKKIVELPFKTIQHVVSTSDAHPVIGVDNNEAVFILVMGQLKTDDDPPHSFSHSFLLRKDATANFFIANEMFRLVLHHG